MKNRPCRWNCGRMTDRHCGICLECCNARDAYDKLIDEGLAPYIPPDQRPGHRFYQRKQLSDAQKAALKKANAAKRRL